MYATIDNSDPVSHTFQGFDGYALIDARLRYALTLSLAIALGADNLGDDKYFLYHPFPQRSLSLELDYAPRP